MFRLGQRLFTIAFVIIAVGLAALNIGLRVTNTHWAWLAWYWPLALAAIVLLVAARLNDAGRSPWWSATCIVPFLALGLGVYLCFAPSAIRALDD